MSYSPESDNHIRHQVRIVFELSNYTTKTNKKMLQVLTCGMNSLKIKVDDLDFDKSKTVPVHLKKVSHLMSKNVANENRLNTNKIPDVSTLIQKKIGDVG